MEQKVICPSCGAQSSPGQQFCGNCGAKLANPEAQEEVVCPNCGFKNMAGQLFCGSCGSKLAATKPEPTVGAEEAMVSPKLEPEVKAASAEPATPKMLAVPPQVSAKPAETTQQPPEKEKAKKAAMVEKASGRREQVVVRPTMRLAWGLYWRMLIISLLIGIVVYLIIFGVMLAMGGSMPSWPY